MQSGGSTTHVEVPLLVKLLKARGALLADQESKIIGLLSIPTTTVEDAVSTVLRVPGSKIAELYAQQFQLPLAPGELPPPEMLADLASLLPESLCRAHRLIPIQRKGDSLVVAMVDPSDLAVQNQIWVLTGLYVEPVVSPLEVVSELLGRAFSSRP